MCVGGGGGCCLLGELGGVVRIGCWCGQKETAMPECANNAKQCLGRSPLKPSTCRPCETVQFGFSVYIIIELNALLLSLICCFLLEFYVLATSLIILGRVPNCDSLNSLGTL